MCRGASVVVHRPPVGWSFILRRGIAKLVFSALLPTGLLAGSAQSAVAEEKPIEQQIIEIVSSSKGTVRKWVFPPKLAVIYRGDSYRELIDREVATIHARVPGFPGFSSVEYLDLNTVQGSLYGNAKFRTIDSRRVKVPNTFAELTLGKGDRQHVLSANIFVYLVDLEESVLFGALSGVDIREIAEAEISFCQIETLSANDEIKISNIIINVVGARHKMDACIHEELTQSLGLLEDSIGSEVFSYDNTAAERPDRSADYRLLEALYSDQILPGDSPRRVADIYMMLEK
jgi:Protein of unknown function (DUF2927)